MSEKIEHIEKRASTPETASREVGFGGVLDKMRESKNKAIKSFLKNKGLFVGMILVFIVILLFTTDVNFSSKAEVIRLSLVIFVFIFCSYSMYVNCADSGTRAGKNTSSYVEAWNEYNEIKKRIIGTNAHIRLSEFCRWYVEEELKSARKEYLDGAGIKYSEYLTKWVGLDEEAIELIENLSQAKKTAIIKANSLKPIKLTPDMLIKRGRGNRRRAPLGVQPEIIKNINYVIRFGTTAATSLFTCMLALEAISNPSWAMFAELCIKILMVVLSGFAGYKMGYENITVTTVNYILDQTDLLNQFEQYLAGNPAPAVEESIEK